MRARVAVLGAVAIAGVAWLLTAAVPVAGADSCPNAVLRTGSAAGLPDCRAFELVSPADAQGEVYAPEVNTNNTNVNTHEPMRAAAGGDGIAYIGDPPPSGGNGAVGNALGNQYLAERGATGWTADDITPPASDTETRYEAFSSDLSQGFLASEDYHQPALASDAPPNCIVLYSRTISNGSYHALFTETQTPGYCGLSNLFGSGLDNLLFAGASADGSQLLFQTQAALIPQATEATGEGNDLYDSVGGRLSLVNVLPGVGGATANDATFGAFSNPEEPPDFSDVFSSDGSRVYWTDLSTGRIYLRENPTQPQSALDGEGVCTEPAMACSVQVSGAGPAEYWTSASAGRYAYYTENGGLWRFDALSETREALAGPGAAVQGVIGASEDGSYLYFLAGGALAPGAEARSCEVSNQGEEEQGHLPPGVGCNLYLLRTGGSVRFIAALSALDNQFETESGSIGDWRASLGYRTAELTPDGHSLLFGSWLHLAEAGGARAGGVFVYDADSERISCVSCNPSGQAPLKNPGSRVGNDLPVSYSDLYMPRWISADGSRVFLDNEQPLVTQGTEAQDVSGFLNVFEWQREGSADCPRRVPASLNGGCVYLLSPSGGSSDSVLVDASASGDDVFFVDREQLVPQASEQLHLKLYDARVNGGFSAPVESLPCIGEACRGASSSPSSSSGPGSATFYGDGNLAPSVRASTHEKTSRKKVVRCSKGKKRSHGRCVREKVKAKRSSDNRRGK